VPLGVPVLRARFCILLLAAVLTATSTMLVGSLSFIGLLAPHIARLAGARRSRPQLLASALIGAALMTVAEWLSRQLLFPEEMPTGLVACLLGAPGLVLLIWRRRA
jgi:ferric hydroxamate transport system permease protein